MAQFDWDPTLETGNETIDDQHRSLFKLAKRLAEACESCKGGEIVDDAIYRLTDYVLEHFADEEGLMRDSAYPELSSHHVMHELLTGDTLRFTARHFNDDDVAGSELASFVVSWLRIHIEQEDRRLAMHLAGPL